LTNGKGEPQIRCYSCDCNLSDFESTRKSKTTGEYLDLCEDCFSTVAEDFITTEEQLELNLVEAELNEL